MNLGVTYLEYLKDEVSGGQGVYVQLLSLNGLLKCFHLISFIAIEQVKNGLKS